MKNWISNAISIVTLGLSIVTLVIVIRLSNEYQGSGTGMLTEKGWLEDLFRRRTEYRPPPDYLEFENWFYYPIKDGYLKPDSASEITRRIAAGGDESMSMLRRQVSKKEMEKFDTLKGTSIEIRIKSKFENVRVWLNGVDLMMAGNKVKIDGLPLRPDTIYLSFMVLRPDQSKMEGTIKINGKEKSFEFKELGHLRYPSVKFMFKDFKIDSCTYITKCKLPA